MGVATLLTAEQYARLPDEPGTRFELIDGEMSEVSFAGALHSLIVGIVYRLLAEAAHEHGGYAFPDGVGYILSRRPDTVRGPDASYVAATSVPETGVPAGFWPTAPDLAVEVASPDDRPGELRAKARTYLDAGTSVVWLLWPATRSVTVALPGGMAVELGPEDELDGGELLPRLRVRVADLFPTTT